MLPGYPETDRGQLLAVCAVEFRPQRVDHVSTVSPKRLTISASSRVKASAKGWRPVAGSV